MAASIRQFSEALLLPEEHLLTLHDCEVMISLEGIPALHRTSTMVEAEIRRNGTHYLLAMPLNEHTAIEIEQRASALQRLRHRALASLRVLPDELRSFDLAGRPTYTTLYLQELAGESFEEVTVKLDPTSLNDALERLGNELAALPLAHNNLKAENLRWREDHLEVIRPWFAEVGGDITRDQQALAQLRRPTTEKLYLSDCEADYEASTTRDWCGHEFEGLICFHDEAGYGYMDRDEQVVIAPQFRWADDFHEGRAVVECEEGMGLINRTGDFVLPPRYEIVEYLYAESIVRVRKEGLWATFDITGEQIEPFKPLEA